MANVNNRLVRFVLRHSALGSLAGVSFVGLLLLFDVGRLQSLVLASDVGLLAVSVLAAFFAITFGSVQVGIALMLKSEAPEDDETGRKSALQLIGRGLLTPPALQPARIRQPYRQP